MNPFSSFFALRVRALLTISALLTAVAIASAKEPDSTDRPALATPKAKGTRSARIRVVDARDSAPIAGVTVEAVRWDDPRDKTVDAVATTDAQGIALCQGLSANRYHWRLSAKVELPYIGNWTASELDGGDVVIRLKRACQLVLRAVDAETGRGIAGVKFGRERELAEYWLQVVVPDTLGANRPVRYQFDPNPKLPPESAYETDQDGYYRCLVGPETWSYAVYDHPPGYTGIVPIKGKHELELPTPSGGKVEYTFRLVRSKPANP